MAAPATTKATIRKQTVEAMKKLGVYRGEYDRVIDLYASLWEQYHRLMSEYDDGRRYRYAVETADGGEKKSPLSATIESVRRDIMTCSSLLMLNPRAEKDGKQMLSAAKKSKLEEALKNL
jgi:phage terminase small subunit